MLKGLGARHDSQHHYALAGVKEQSFTFNIFLHNLLHFSLTCHSKMQKVQSLKRRLICYYYSKNQAKTFFRAREKNKHG